MTLALFDTSGVCFRPRCFNQPICQRVGREVNFLDLLPVPAALPVAEDCADAIGQDAKSDHQLRDCNQPGHSRYTVATASATTA